MFIQPLFLPFLILFLHLYITMKMMTTTTEAGGKTIPKISSVVYV